MCRTTRLRVPPSQLVVDGADTRRAQPLHMQASAARALGQLVASLPPESRERVCAELELVPWLCTLLTRETFSPECQKAAVQSLQLLALCDGQPLEQLRLYLGPAALKHIVESQDAVQVSTIVRDRFKPPGSLHGAAASPK